MEGIVVETSKQVSVFLENKPGRLANVLSALERDKINVSGLTVMDSHEHSVLRLVTSDQARTKQVLKSLGIPYTESEVLLVELRNQPGAIAHVCEQLAAEHINIEYCYVSATGRNGKTLGVFKVANAEKAIRVLSQPAAGRLRRAIGRRPMQSR
jgi:hypothetical protein